MVTTIHSEVAQTTQIGVESVEGTAVAANKRLLSLSIMPTADGTFSTFRPSGSKVPSLVVMGKSFTTAPYTGKLTYTDVVYLLASGVNYAAPSGSASYTWTAEPDDSDVNTLKSYTVEWGDSAAAYKAAGLRVNEFGYKINRETADISGNFIARTFTPDITLTGSPTDISLVPVMPHQVSLYYADSWANLTASPTKMDAGFEWDYKKSNIVSSYWPLDDALTSFAGLIENALTTTLSVVVAADTASSDFTAPYTLAHMQAGDTIYLKLVATGGIIETTNHFKFTHLVALKISAPPKFQTVDNAVRAISWQGTIVHDGTAGKSESFEVVNDVASL